jgi:hypothetical protein
MCCDYVAHPFKDWVRQNVADENRLALVYRCATRSALWANLRLGWGYTERPDGAVRNCISNQTEFDGHPVT